MLVLPKQSWVKKPMRQFEDNKVLFELNVDIPAEENFPLEF